MLITNQEAVDLLRGLQTACSSPDVRGNSKFTYAMAKNRRILRPVYDEIQKKMVGLLSDYEKEMGELSLKFSKKDDKGKVVYQRGQTTLDPLFRDDFEKSKNEINEKYKLQLEEKDVYLNSEREVNLHLIGMVDFPEMADYIADLLFPIREEVK